MDSVTPESAISPARQQPSVSTTAKCTPREVKAPLQLPAEHHCCGATASEEILAAAAAGMASAAATAFLPTADGCSTLVPSEDAVRMANIGATAIPGMSPMDYRQALYQTWMTGEPAGMQFMGFDSELEVQHAMSDAK